MYKKNITEWKNKIKNSSNIKWIFILLNVLMFTKNRNIKIKREIDKKVNLYSRFILTIFWSIMGLLILLILTIFNGKNAVK